MKKIIIKEGENLKESSEEFYNKLEVDEIIPTKISDLDDDVGLILEHQSLDEFYKKSEVNGLLDSKQNNLPTNGNGDKFLSDDGSFKEVIGDVVSVNGKVGNVILSADDVSSYTKSEVDVALTGKVNVVDGKQLSTNDYTDEDKQKLENLSDTYSKSEIDTKLDNKVTTEVGKGLSSNDYTITDKTKVNNITTDGLGDKFLADDGTYREVASIDAYTKQQTDTLLLDKANKNDISMVGYSNEYNDLDNKPSNLSDFNNDAGYLTTHQSLDNYYNKSEVNTLLDDKVTKETGKGLSTNDYTTAEKSKLSGIEPGADKTPDLSIYALKSDLKDATQMEFNGVPLDGLKRYVYDTTASGGEWSIDYSDKGFTTFVNVYFYSIANGTKLEDRTIPTLRQGQPTLTGCSGYLMSASSAGLLVGMTLVNGSGTVRIIVEGV